METKTLNITYLEALSIYESLIVGILRLKETGSLDRLIVDAISTRYKLKDDLEKLFPQIVIDNEKN